MAEQLQDIEDPAVAFFKKMIEPSKLLEFEIEGLEPRLYGNERFEEFFQAAGEYPIDALDIRDAIARLL